MKVVRILLIAVSFICIALPPAARAADAAKEKDIIRLLEVTGTLQIADQMAVGVFQQFVRAMKTADPKVPQGALNVVEKETVAFMRENMAGMISQIVPVYDQTFSHQEIKEILAFYATETGKKMISTMPGMVQQSSLVAQKYFAPLIPQLQQRLVTKLKAAGYQ